jgi:DnaJ-class molecular chaperone
MNVLILQSFAMAAQCAKVRIVMPNEDLNLVPAIRAIEEQISKLNSEYVKKITPYKESLAKLKEINTACETCCGTGKVFRRSCAEDEGDYYTCPDCKGSGKCADHV